MKKLLATTALTAAAPASAATRTACCSSFSGAFQKTWTSGKKDVVLVCDGTNHDEGPTAGEYSDESFRATLRQVQ